MIKLAICDDEAAQCELVSASVRHYFTKNSLPLTLFTYKSSEELLISCQDYGCLDIVLLDIQMGEMDGVALAKELRRYNPALAIIFITGMTDYIYEGFELHAINYLLKPFEEKQLFSCLDKAVALCRQQDAVLLLQVQKELIKLPLADIIRAESSGHYLNLVTRQENYCIKKSMKELEEELAATALEGLFFKISRSDLISLDAVKKITSKEVEMLGGDRVIIPKGRHKEVSEAFMKHHFHGGNTL